jgi:hypothetical protein
MPSEGLLSHVSRLLISSLLGLQKCFRRIRYGYISQN